MELTIQRQLGPRRNHCGRWLVGCPSCGRLVRYLYGWDRSTRLAARDMAARWIPEILRRERAQGHAVPALGLPTHFVLEVAVPGEMPQASSSGPASAVVPERARPMASVGCRDGGGCCDVGMTTPTAAAAGRMRAGGS